MVRLTLVLTLLLWLSSCAEILQLSGGPKDEAAPKPTASAPEQGALNVQTKSVEITFDEYFKLQDAATTLSMNPSVGPLTTSVSKKTLTVSWENDLQPETTYILNFNGTIRDNNEGNDTIFQVVFSTGSIIDSLTRKGKVVSAYSNEPIANATVALYLPDSMPTVAQPSYVARTDKFGNFNFSYLKQADYVVFAYSDQNKNQEIDKTENLAFKTGYSSDTSFIELRLFKPKTVTGKLQVVLEKPGTAILSGKDFTSEPVSINGNPVAVYFPYRNDSIKAALPVEETGRYTFVSGSDTLVRLLALKDRNSNFKIKTANSKQWLLGSTLYFTANEVIQGLDETQLTILSESKKEVPYTSKLIAGQFQINPHTKENFTIHFGKNALKGTLNSSDTVSFSFETFEESECAVLILDVSEFDSLWVFELIDNANTEKGTVVSQKKGNGGKLTFNRLIPTTYSIRCFRDENQNGKWDSGDFELALQPEKILRFPIKQKLRANWEVEEKLSGK